MMQEVSNGVIPAAETAIHAKEDFLRRLHSTAAGLGDGEAEARLTRFGPNVLPRPGRARWFVQLAKSFSHLFANLLWVGALLA